MMLMLLMLMLLLMLLLLMLLMLLLLYPLWGHQQQQQQQQQQHNHHRQQQARRHQQRPPLPPPPPQQQQQQQQRPRATAAQLCSCAVTSLTTHCGCCCTPSRWRGPRPARTAPVSVAARSGPMRHQLPSLRHHPVTTSTPFVGRQWCLPIMRGGAGQRCGCSIGRRCARR